MNEILCRHPRIGEDCICLDCGKRAAMIEGILGNEAANLEALHKELEAARKRTQNLLKQVGRPAVCRGPNCGKGLWMVKLNSGSSMPYDPDGVPHWATCVDAEMFKKEKQHGR